jgi:RNA polymerase sigma-70 factor (ECF subfamily)
MTGSPSIAEDVLQEVFLALIRAPDRFDARRAPLRAFLLAVARNQVRKRWEKERRWGTLDDYTFEAVPMDPLAGEVADLVGRAVQSLPPLQREAIVLFQYEGLSLEEVARRHCHIDGDRRDGMLNGCLAIRTAAIASRKRSSRIVFGFTSASA